MIAVEKEFTVHHCTVPVVTAQDTVSCIGWSLSCWVGQSGFLGALGDMELDTSPGQRDKASGGIR